MFQVEVQIDEIFRDLPLTADMYEVLIPYKEGFSTTQTMRERDIDILSYYKTRYSDQLNELKRIFREIGTESGKDTSCIFIPVFPTTSGYSFYGPHKPYEIKSISYSVKIKSQYKAKTSTRTYKAFIQEGKSFTQWDLFLENLLLHQYTFFVYNGILVKSKDGINELTFYDENAFVFNIIDGVFHKKDILTSDVDFYLKLPENDVNFIGLEKLRIVNENNIWKRYFKALIELHKLLNDLSGRNL